MNTLWLSAILLCAAPAVDDVRYPAKPGPRDFIFDEARLLSADDAAAVKALCEEALTKKRAPIIVVTLSSLADYGARGWPIDRYAMNLMSEWGVGWEDWNYGMLLLVSKGDRKARIELGGSWARRKDDEARRILSDRMIPKFRQGDYSKGILSGVQGLHDVALDAVPARTTHTAPSYPSPMPAPSPRAPAPGSGCLPIGGLGLLVVVIGAFVLISIVSRMLRGGVSSWGNSGPGYYGGGYYNQGYGGGGFGSSFGGGLLGGALGSILADQYNRRSSSSYSDNSPSFSPPQSSDSGGSSGGSDSSFGGGSFGGGFSGGGGATGEW
ncbi:MAG TPA: TPM domain-containing protein [Planctomycetota bacterium]|jgi:uncharacterized protein|nr:TPM domain-containing protein [Planctomycetota bacterium]